LNQGNRCFVLGAGAGAGAGGGGGGGGGGITCSSGYVEESHRR